MKKFLYCLCMLCSCAFISCSDDELTLEEKREMLVGKWELTDMDAPFNYVEYYEFNSNGTATITTIHEFGKYVEEVSSYRLEEEEGTDNLCLYYTYELDMKDVQGFRYIEEFSEQRISMRLGILTCDARKYYKKVK